MRILFAGIFHETHCFVPDTTPLADFKVELDDAVLARRGDGSQIDGFLEVADREGWEIVTTCSYTATPSGMVEDRVLEAFWADLLPRAERAAKAGVDAIYLSLHGAMICQSLEDVEGELLRRLRAIPGLEALPLFGVFDLHANLTQPMVELAQGLVCYRENPHADARDAGLRAAELLARCLDTGVVPKAYRRGVPVVWPPTGTGTGDGPMQELEALARQLEAEDADIWAINVVAGFSFADAHDAGVGFSVISSGPAAKPEAALDRLAERALAIKESGLVRDLPPDAAIDQALAVTGKGPVLLVEPSENIGAGAPGNGTGLLRALVRRDLQNAGCIINDPEAVQALLQLQPGATVTLPIGGKDNPFDEGPLLLEVTLLSTSNGHFDLEDLHSHLIASQGRHIDMGPTAMVRHRGITLMLTSIRTPPNDLGQWRSQGINPEELDYICIKAGVAHRQAYNPIASGSFNVATPGACTSDPTLLPYKRIRRPVFPLDRI